MPETEQWSHEEIDKFAAEVEQAISEGRRKIDSIPEFENRGPKARKLERFFGNNPVTQ